MSGDLTLLEKKFDQFIAFCEGLHAENRALRAHVAKLEEDRLTLQTKIDSARTRLEALMDKLPVETE